jgi:hypothetical protein
LQMVVSMRVLLGGVAFLGLIVRRGVVIICKRRNAELKGRTRTERRR